MAARQSLTRWMMALCVLVTAGMAALAQSGGDFCVRAFEDLNGNGVRDTADSTAFEPLLRAGIGADLLNEGGVVVGSALLADSPTADQGVICFQFLPDGQYTIQITSADYRATTPDTMTAAIRTGELPAVMELGVQSLLVAPSVVPDAPAVNPNAQLERVLVAAAVALGVAVVMQLLGLVLYAVRFGRKRKADLGATGSYKPAQ
jgi:hypothetical protein